MYSLSGKIAVVTGGAQGIGLGICKELAKGGASLYIIDIKEETAKNAVEELTKAGFNAQYGICNVCDMAAMNQMMQHIREKEGHLDILVNNAGINRRKPSFEVTPDDWDAIINTNLKATYFNSVNAARIMKEQGYGRIINTSSTTAFQVRPQRSVYAISKIGVLQLTKYLAREYASLGITVNGIAPGLIRTPMNMTYFQENPEAEKEAIALIPVGHPGTPEDIGITVRFLASDEARHITGHIIAVDGGALIAG